MTTKEDLYRATPVQDLFNAYPKPPVYGRAEPACHHDRYILILEDALREATLLLNESAPLDANRCRAARVRWLEILGRR